MRTVTFWLTKPFAHCQFKNREVDKVFRVRQYDLTYFKQSVAEVKSVAFSSQTPVAENWRGGFCRSSLTLLIWTSLCSLSTSKAWKRLARYQLSLCVKRTLLHENGTTLRVKHARHDLHSDVIACMAEDRKNVMFWWKSESKAWAALKKNNSCDLIFKANSTPKWIAIQLHMYKVICQGAQVELNALFAI